jgi:hypothetical protein
LKVSNPNVTISGDGLEVESTKKAEQHVYATKGFDISGNSPAEEDNFTGTIIYYFEVKQKQTSPGETSPGE